MLVLEPTDLSKAYEGSYYTICSVENSAYEWLEGYWDMLVREDIGKPVKWIICNGEEVNDYASTHGVVINPLKDDCSILMFPLDTLDVEKLSVARIHLKDYWFNDIIDNIIFKDTRVDIS